MKKIYRLGIILVVVAIFYLFFPHLFWWAYAALAVFLFILLY